jgi:mono/diheme cytochrome c family protein
MKVPALLAAVLFAATAAAALAQEKAVPLKPGPGQDVVDANCGACHSLDYIRTNAPFMTAKVWDAEVTKMIKVYGAPIEPADAKMIIEYLSKAYGTPG